MYIHGYSYTYGFKSSLRLFTQPKWLNLSYSSFSGVWRSQMLPGNHKNSEIKYISGLNSQNWIWNMKAKMSVYVSLIFSCAFKVKMNLVKILQLWERCWTKIIGILLRLWWETIDIEVLLSTLQLSYFKWVWS